MKDKKQTVVFPLFFSVYTGLQKHYVSHPIGWGTAVLLACLLLNLTPKVTAQNSVIVPSKESPLVEALKEKYSDFRIADSLLGESRVEDSRTYIACALRDARGNGDYVLYMAACNYFQDRFTKQGLYEQALDLLKHGVDLESPEGRDSIKLNSLRAELHNNIGKIYCDKKNCELALKHHLLALEYADNDPVKLYETHHHIAHTYFENKDYVNARKYVSTAWQYYDKSREKNFDKAYQENGLNSVFYQNMASAAFGMGDHDNAFEFYTKALKLIKASDPVNRQHINLYSELANYHYSKDEYEKSKRYVRKAEAAITELGIMDSPYTKTLISLKGDIAFAQGKDKEALNHYKTCLDQATYLFGEVHPEVAETYLRIGALYDFHDNYELAQKQYRLALTALGISAQKENGSEPAYQLPFSLSKTVKVYMAIAKTHTNAEELWKAFAAYQNAVDAAFKLCSEVIFDPYENLQYQTVQSAVEGSLWVTLKLLESPELGKDEKTKLFDGAIKNMEYAKKMRYWLSIGLKDERNFDNSIPRQTREFERECAANIAFYNSLLITRKNKQGSKTKQLSLEEIEEILKNNTNRRNTLLDSLKKHDLSYYELAYGQKVCGISEVKDVLKKSGQSQIWVFFEGQSTFFGMFFSNASLPELTKFGDKMEFLSVINDYRSEISNLPADNGSAHMAIKQFSKKSYKLYRAIFEQIPLENDTILPVIIIPDGELFNLPFEALVRDTIAVPDSISALVDYKNLDYLIDHFDISYAESFTALDIALNKKSITKPRNYTGFGLHRFGDNTERQVNNLADIFKGITYKSDDAKLANFRNVKSSSILHLALKGLFNDTEPGKTTLSFWKEPSAPPTASHISLNELYGALFQTNLLIVNQMEIDKNDGSLSYQHFSKCLQYINCPSLIYSLWYGQQNYNTSIMEKTGNLIMESHSLQYALSQSKRDLLKQESNLVHPYYWANILSSGNPLPIKFKVKKANTPYRLFVAAAITALLMLLLYLFFYKKPRQEIVVQ